MEKEWKILGKRALKEKGKKHLLNTDLVPGAVLGLFIHLILLSTHC